MTTSSFIHNIPKLETRQISTSRKMNKPIVASPCNGDVLISKRESKLRSMQQLGWILQTLCWAKEARHQRGHIAWSLSHEVLTPAKLLGGDRNTPIASKEGFEGKKQDGTIEGDRNVAVFCFGSKLIELCNQIKCLIVYKLFFSSNKRQLTHLLNV